VARDRDLRLLAGAIGVSAIGDFIVMIALALQVNSRWEGGAGVAVLLICLWSPVALLAGHVGVLVDRFETRLLAILTSLFQALMAVALAFVHMLAATFVLTFLLGAGIAVSGAAEFALVPLLAGTRATARANGLVESMRGVGFVVGPAIGGLLSGGGGPRLALLTDAATFLVIGVVLALLPVRRRVTHSAGQPPRARDGMALLFGNRTLLITLGTGSATLVFMSASIPADVVYAQNVLGKGDFAVGLVLTAWALGLVVAANLVPQRIPAAAVATATLLGATVQGGAKFVGALWLSYGFMVACWTVGGMGHGVKNTGFRTLIHGHVPDESHGRAFAAFNGLRNTAELVALAAGGVLVAAVGARMTLWIAGGAAAAVALFGVGALTARSGQAEAARANAS
jgi:MFS family permease